MPHPVTLDAAGIAAGAPARAAFVRGLGTACRDEGFLLLQNHGIPAELWRAVLADAAAFFARPAADKERLHIRRSTNHRGFSRMQNSRDWREQLHFAAEWPEGEWSPGKPDHYRLAGGNPWPDAAFASTLLRYMAAVQGLGFLLLDALGECLGLPPRHFERLSDEPPYLLLKLISYHVQPARSQRNGVAAHCDWSWITILLQDSTGGLEVQDRNGEWWPVPPQPGILAVNVGELLEIQSRGHFRAAPHRVISPATRQRVSVPAFINPPLDARIEPLVTPPAPIAPHAPEKEHIHRVVPQGAACEAFVFGESEWRRKGLGGWCHDPRCLS
ncbi:MAG: 2-oxoglutarate and iron-dependent oxygenase domain-containing protein [Accumulibacter sp.]|jgi:isopenicillin N synthase-like dioxygenase|uniref:2-oxoglutarate and iron-dependent oxygenase domain-containing protein n=1 Tax=Accumulibacter sp. TaxID=2053492 RepID=UPI002FC2DB5F